MPNIIQGSTEELSNKLTDIPDQLFAKATKMAEEFAESRGFKASENNGHEDIGTAYTSSSAFPCVWFVENSRKGAGLIAEGFLGVGYDGKELVIVKEA